MTKKTLKEITNKIKSTYFKMLIAYSKGKVEKGKKHEAKLIKLELKKKQ